MGITPDYYISAMLIMGNNHDYHELHAISHDSDISCGKCLVTHVIGHQIIPMKKRFSYAWYLIISTGENSIGIRMLVFDLSSTMIVLIVKYESDIRGIYPTISRQYEK